MSNSSVERNCPECTKLLTYSSKYSKQLADKKRTLCLSCKQLGERNHRFGTKHTKEYIEKRKKEKPKNGFKKGNKLGGYSYERVIKKYGKELGERKYQEFVEKQRNNNSGEKNNRYGKPSPQGSGNGWSGWYQGWYFRSLLELSYMINEIEVNNLNWKTAETNDYSIKYIDPLGKERNYFPDFIIEDKYMIECKPKRLWNTPSVLCKKKYAEEFCKEKGLEYKLVDIKKLTNDKIKELYNSGNIKFLDRYEIKLKDKYL